MALLDVQLLGGFRLSHGTEPITSVDSPRLQSLLAYLVLHRDAPQSRQYLSWLFWPDSTEKQARTNLRQLLYYLRRLLPHADRFLHTDSKKLQWRPDASFALDVAEFENALAVVKAEATGDLRSLRAALTRATELYQGDLLPSCYDDWIIPARERLREEYSATLQRLIALLEQERDYAAAVRYAECLRRHDPLSEATYRTLMRLYALNRDCAAAVRIYERCAAVLERELGIEPGRAIQEMYERLLSLEPRREDAAARAKPDSAFRLVGRRHEWEQLRAAWYVAARGRAQLFLISGEAGIGKTRLAEELLGWAARQGIATARTRSYVAEGRLAYAPVTEWLRSPSLRTTFSSLDTVWLVEIARLLPELRTQRSDLPRPEPLTETWQRRHLFEALARAVLAPDQPLLLLIDDLQWCDQETLEWLRFLLRLAPAARLLVLGTVRSEEVEPDHPLMPLLRELGHEGQVGELALRPLDAAETASLAAEVTGVEFAPERASRLFQETEGNPLFVVESVRAGLLNGGASENGRLENTPSPASLLPASPPLPPTVYAVISARLAQLSPAARDLASLAATIGRAFTLDVLTIASDADEAGEVQGLEELCRRHIVREQDDRSYDFTHDKLREVAYAQTSAAGRRLLHQRVAGALEAVHTADLDSVSGRLAAHYDHADLPKPALRSYRRAAEVAQRIYAHAEAAGYLRRSLELLQRLPADHEREALELDLQIALGSSLVPLEGYGAGEIHTLCERVRVLSRSLGEPPPAPMLRTLALGKLAAGDPAGAGELGAELAIRGEEVRDPVVAVEGHYLLGVVRFWQGDFSAARQHLERALDLYDVRRQRIHLASYAQDPAVICRIRLALCLWYLGYPDQAGAERQAALAHAAELAHPLSLAYALNYAAWLSTELGHRRLAAEQAEAAMQVAQEHQLGFWPPTARVLRGWVLAQRGQLQAGITQIHAGIAAHQEMGQPLHLPYAFVLLARAHRLAGESEHGLGALAEAETLMESTGIHFLESEVERLRGELLAALDGNRSEAGRHFRKALEIARRQGAAALELRAATRLCRWLHDQGRAGEAQQQLQPVLGRICEGFDTLEFQEAAELLERLS